MQEKNRIAVLSLSGGLDSTTLLAESIVTYGIDNVVPVQFVYGSKHNPYEVVAVTDVVQHYFGNTDVLIRVDLCQPFQNIRSNLMASGDKIPEGHYNDESMRLTVVPGRNLIFASICAAIAETLAVQRKREADVLLGVHGGDHFIYPDCRPEFILSLAETIFKSSDGRVQVLAPYSFSSKSDLVSIGTKLNVPYQLTRTCYKAQERPCGKCGSCRERLEAFERNGLVDPVTYAE